MDHDNLASGKCFLHAGREVALSQPIPQCAETAVETGARCCFNLAGFIQKGNPGIVITQTFRQCAAGIENQLLGVLFLGNQLVHIADRTQDRIQALLPCICLLESSVLLLDLAMGFLEVGDVADSNHQLFPLAFLALLTGFLQCVRPGFDPGVERCAAFPLHADDDLLLCRILEEGPETAEEDRGIIFNNGPCKGFSTQVRIRLVNHGIPGLVGLFDNAGGIEHHVSHRSELIQRGEPVPGFLQGNLCVLQLFILQLKLDLVNGKFLGELAYILEFAGLIGFR